MSAAGGSCAPGNTYPRMYMYCGPDIVLFNNTKSRGQQKNDFMAVGIYHVEISATHVTFDESEVSKMIT